MMLNRNSLRANLLGSATPAVLRPAPFIAPPDSPSAAWALFNESVAAHQAGDVTRAALGYHAILSRLPDHSDSLHLLGLITAEHGDANAGLDLIQKAIAADPRHAVYHNNASLALMQCGRYADAIVSARTAAKMEPSFVSWTANLADALRLAGNFEEAMTCCQQALILDPRHAPAHNTMSILLCNAAEPEEARRFSRRALELDPDSAQGYSSLGDALRGLLELDEAIEAYETALKLRPKYFDVLCNLSTALKIKGDLEGAEARLLEAIGIHPRRGVAHGLLGEILIARQRADEAIPHLLEAIAQKPDDTSLLSQLANCYDAIADAANRVKTYRRLIELDPESAYWHFYLATALLASGHFSEGWREFAWHWKTNPAISRSPYMLPTWKGEDGEGRTLLVRNEHANGDGILFCRFAALAKAKGFRVIVQVQPALVRLVRSLENVDRVIALDARPPAFDLQCSMMGMPICLGTTMTTIPSSEGYLKAEPADVEFWRDRLARSQDSRLKVGICWAGATYAHLPDLAARTIPTELLRPIFAVEGARFISLTKAEVPPPEGGEIEDYMDEMQDFADTAALISCLDLVISIDTSVIHLAGALGKRAILMDRLNNAAWFWHAGRTDSPWYDSLTIRKQTTAGVWDTVIEKVASDLSELVERHARKKPQAAPVHPVDNETAPAVLRDGPPAIEDMPDLQAHNHLLGDVEALDQVYKTTGYIFLRDVLPKAAIGQLRARYIEKLKSIEAYGASVGDGVIWSGGRKGDFKLDRYIADSPWRAFAADPEVNELMHSVLGEPAKWSEGVDYKVKYPNADFKLQRLDNPHQDGPYMSQQVRILWVPVAPIDASIGGIALVEGMAQRGNRHSVREGHTAGIDLLTLPRDRWRRSDCGPGDLLLLHPWSPHASVQNSSTEGFFRLSMDMRILN